MTVIAAMNPELGFFLKGELPPVDPRLTLGAFRDELGRMLRTDPVLRGMARLSRHCSDVLAISPTWHSGGWYSTLVVTERGEIRIRKERYDFLVPEAEHERLGAW